MKNYKKITFGLLAIAFLSLAFSANAGFYYKQPARNLKPEIIKKEKHKNTKTWPPICKNRYCY